MKKIYSHHNIEKNLLTKDFFIKIDTGKVCKYSISYNPELVINMEFLGAGNSKTNRCGWYRDKNYFFKQLLEEHPEIFSEENKMAIADGNQPLVDNKYIEHFPEYKEFIGDELIHHHIGEDGQAVPLPVSIHRGYGGVHNDEKELGITEEGIKFSQEVQKDFEMGKTFKWDSADEIMDRYIDKKANNKRSTSDKESTKEKANNNNKQKQYWKNKFSGWKDISIKYLEKRANDEGFESVQVMLKTGLVKVALDVLQAVPESIERLKKQERLDKLNEIKGSYYNSDDDCSNDKFSVGTPNDDDDNDTDCSSNSEDSTHLNSPKKPHDRRSHPRKLGSGKVIHVKASKIHPNDDLLKKS